MSLHLYRRKASPTAHWHAQAYVGGRRYRFTCRTPDKATAREVARQRLAELRERHNRGLVGLPEPVRVSEAVTRWEAEYAPRLRPSSAKRLREVLTAAQAWFTARRGDPPVQRVTPADVAAFLDAKRRAGAGARTVNLYRANLHRLFALCVRPWGLVTVNPVAATLPLPVEACEPRLLSDADYVRLLAKVREPMLRLFCVLGWETGARSAELLQLEWRDVDFSNERVTFRNDPATGRTTKGRRSRTLPLSRAALDALRDHAARFRLAAPPSPWVFTHRRHRKDAKPGDRLRTMYVGFVGAARRAGLAGLHPHCLRHAFVTRKLAEGVPVALVSRYVGHSQISVTQRYAHLLGEHLRAVVAPTPAAVAR